MEDDDDDPLTRKVVAPLLGATEETPDVVETLIKTHQLMEKKNRDYSKRYKKKAYEIL